jgi:hypothetical protein
VFSDTSLPTFRRNIPPPFLGHNCEYIKAAPSSETLVTISQTTKRHTSHDNIKPKTFIFSSASKVTDYELEDKEQIFNKDTDIFLRYGAEAKSSVHWESGDISSGFRWRGTNQIP